MSGLTFLTDAPTLPEAVADAPPAESWIQVAKTGKFKHPLYGNFTISRSTFDAFIRNLDQVSGGQIPIDFDHVPDKGGPTIARGWIKALEQRAGGTELWARVDWTDSGAEAVRKREYLFISPTWKLKYVRDDGSEPGPTMLGAALTNRPWFERMAVVNLTHTFSTDSFAMEDDAPDDDPDTYADVTAEERRQLAKDGHALPDGSYPIRNRSDLESALTLVRSGHGNVDAAKALIRKRAKDLGCEDALPNEFEQPSDSRPAMSEFAKIALTFGLPETATEEEIVKAAQAARVRSEDGAKFSAIAAALGVEADADQAAVLARIDALKPAGDFVTISRDKLVELQNFAQEAEDGRAARENLAEMRFSLAFEKAMREGRAAPGTREDLKALFENQPEQTLDLIESLPPVVNTTALGSSGGAFGAVPPGQDPERWQLDQRAQIYARDHKVSYIEAVEAVSAGAR